MDDLRCPSRIHGKSVDDHILEVKCDSQKCGAGKGAVVFHYFDLTTRTLIDTKRFKEPKTLFAGRGDDR